MLKEKKFNKGNVMNYGMELNDSYLTPDSIECMSVRTRKDILESLDSYDDDDTVVVVVTGKLVEGGIELQGVYSDVEVSNKSCWSSWGLAVEIVRYMMKNQIYLEPSEYWSLVRNY